MKAIQLMGNYRMTAKVVGVMYLAGFVVGIGGTVLIQSILGAPNPLSIVSENSMKLAIGAILWLIAVVGDAAHGIVMFPILKQQSERLAYGYLSTRIMDAMFIAIMVLFMVLQIPLGKEYLNATGETASQLQILSSLSQQASQYAYQFGMITLGFSGLILNYVFYKMKLVPRWIAIWGLVGYTIILVGMVSAVMGSGLADMSSIPGGLWELFMGVWLIVKGFSSPVTTEVAS
ncbi:MAG: DUF4386 domain-containing protein [Bacteroidetes bacterium]|nr:DUF4386 domain-containing protein [Bacteroidota bacterium]